MQRRPISTCIAICLQIPTIVVTISWLFYNYSQPWDNSGFWLFIGLGWWFHCRGEHLQTQREITRRKIKTLERNLLNG